MLSKSADEKILSQWDQIKDAFASSITGMFPISGRKNTLELTNLIYDDSKAKDADIKSQQLAKEQEKTWGVPVFAEFVLKDKETGNVINRSKQKIAVLPKMTQRFTYIIGGGEYNSAYQQRIKSGIYSKINEKGEHLTEINLNGRNNAFVKEARLKIPFDLETKKFKFNYATNNIPLYSFLKCVGVSDDEMKKEWGEDVWKANHTTKWQDDIKKMYEKKWKGRGLKVEGDSFEHLQTAVTEALSKSAVLPETTKLTLGRPVEKLSGKEILDASTHLLKTARGERAPDDQASMVFKQLLGLDDFISEKFNSPKTGQALKLKIRNNVDRKDKVSSIISSDFFNRPLSQVFYSNALSQRPDQTNPLDILASKSLVTSMGPGGITSEHQLRPSMKMVNQTHFGVIDPIMTPEGETTGISLHLPIGVRKIGREAKVYVYDTHEKKYAYKNPAEIHGDWLGSPDYFNWKGGHPVAAKEKVMAMSPDNHDFMEVDPKKVRYIIPSSRNLFTEATNAIPFLQCNQGNRTMTGSRQPSQGVSLVNREAPLVQVKSNSKDSFEKVFGSNFSHAAPEEGKVTHFVKDELGNTEEIHITDKSGNTHKVQIYNHFPLNEKKTFIHSEPTVKIGDSVTKGQTIADSNFSVSGEEEFYFKRGDVVKKTKFKDFVFNEPTEVLSLNRSTLTVNWMPLTNFIKHTSKDPLVKVTTRCGREFTVTRSHSCLTMDINGALITIKPKDMEVGKTVVPVTGTFVPDLKSTEDVRAFYPSTRRALAATKKLINVIPLTREIGFLVGLYLSEGSINNSRYVSFAAMNEDIRESVRQCVASLGYKCTESSTTMLLGHAQLARWFGHHFGKGAKNKKIPDWVIFSNTDFLKGLVDGCWSGDGSVYKTKNNSIEATLQTNSENLGKGLQYILSSFGIQSSLHSFTKEYPQFKNAQKTHYRLRVAGSDVVKLPTLTHKIKEKNRLNVGVICKEAVSIVPAPYNLISGRLKSKAHLKGFVGRAFATREANKNSASWTHTTKEDYKLYRNILNSPILWDVVESIEPVAPEEWVYDLEVESTHTFILASGVAVHNTAAGTMATGVNMHTGYVNYKSLTFEDSVVISESAAKKLSSIHMHRPTIETGPEDVISLNKFLAYASSAGKKIKKDKLDNLDKDGVIKPGTRVKPGDILVAAVGKNELPEDFAKLGARLKGAILPYRDKSLVWDSEHEGEVVKVIKKPGDTGYTVHVKTVEPMKVGDKLCYDEETEILTKTGWKSIKDVQLEDEICTLNPGTHVIEYQNPTAIHHYPSDGSDMYKVETDEVDLLVTLEHKMYVRSPSSTEFTLRAAKEIREPVYYLTQEKEVLVNTHSLVPYNKEVFCVTVPNHIVYVCRNGKAVWSGNSARHGDKNIVGAILPDEHMPRVGGPNGKPLEMLTSPTGTPSRINLGQALELAASKIANKTGTPYITSNFQPGVDYAEKIRKELKEHGLKDKEVIYDPLLKVELENPVLTGHKYVLKLKHQVEKKESVRGMDQSLARKYSINEDPSRGGGEGAQAIAQLDMYALLAHGARANLREMTSYKAERQHNSETMADTDFWNRVMLGLPLQPPKATFAYKKFEGMLQGMGLNLKKDGYDTVLTPLTDKGVLHLSAGEITNSKMLRGKDDLEIKGGLFDKKITGGATGKGWSHITLAEPFPNPLFVGTKAQPGPAVVLSGLKYEDFEKVVRGEHTITVGGKELTGGKAISELLKKVDVNKEFEKVKNELKNLSGTTLNKANKKAKFLRALKNLNMKPDEAYIMNHLPVIPPAFRPVVPMSDGSIASADINTLYAHIIQDNAALKDKTTLQYNPELQKKLNASVYDKLKAAIGIGSVPTYEGNKELKGLAKTIAGDNPKSGFFQNKIMKRRQDLSMRSTITPAADLQLDQVAIPKDSAMELYKPFVIRTLIQSGKDLIEATKEVKEQTPMAWKALEHTIKERPVLIKRDPVLHKYNMQAYYPVLKEGKSIGLHPLACGAFNADFDGNCIIGDVIISLKLWYNYSGEDNSALKKALEEKYQMKFTETTKIVAVDNNGVMVEMEIRNMPRIEESLSYDSNGASVYAVPPGIFVWSYNHETNQPTYEPVTHLTVEERCDVAKVNTRRFEVTASTNESLCVYDHDTEQLVDICPKDAIGRLSPVMKRIPITGSINDYELGWLIGAFLSDGAAPGTTIMYTKASQPHRDRFFAALQNLQGGTVNRRTYEEVHGPLEEISGISVKDHYTNINKSTLDLLQSCYERNERGEVPSGVRSALYKKMPVIACQFAEDTLIGLLAGLIDGDGSISINNSKAKPQVIANFSTSSPYLRDGITFLCRLLGIRNSVSETHPKAGRVQKHVNYTISFSTVDLQKIAPRLRLVKEDSINALNLLMSQDLKDDGDLVPVPNRIMSLVSSSAGPLKDDPIFASLRTIKSARKAGYYFTRNLAKYVLSFIKAANSLNVDLWEKVVYAEDVVWDTIVSVENLGKTTVYDLAIPTTKVFVVNGGLVIYDTMAVYLPLTEEARKEAIERMLPSKNLFSTTNYGIMHAPDQEAVIGIHLASTWGAKKDKKYNSLQDIVNDKTLHRSDVVKYKLPGGGEKETTKGRAVLASFLPDEYPRDKLDTLLHDSSFSFKKGTIHNYLETAARLDRKKYPDVVDGWRNLGNETAYRAGFSYSIHDLKPNKELRESILKPYHEAAAKVKATSAPQEEKDQKVIEIYSKATKELEDKFTKYYREQDNNMHKMIDIKARGNFGQFRQMVIAPMLMADNKGVIPTPITKSFSEGLSVPEYWNTLYGARMGTLARASGTSVPGAMAKELSNISVSTTISTPDCGVSKGHFVDVIGHDGKEEIDITDRYLAKDLNHGNLSLKKDTLITPDLFAKIKASGVQKIEVRSPLTCKDSIGICQKCMGLNSEGHHHDIGTNIGIIASQALSEPAIQISMDSIVPSATVKIRENTYGTKKVTLFSLFEMC
jgi:DNA-directed RNA polymerase beta subunit/DNA-directed RNA polymerase beta' subunit/intein/homing endonuclease